MAATKTIYKLSWNPSKPMAVATIISLAAVLVAPVVIENLFSELQLDFKVIWNCWFVVFVQSLVSLGSVSFFYEGIPRRQQFRILSLSLALVFIFATISNTIYDNELCETLSRGEMIIHLAAWGAVNIAAMICTLFVYRLEPVKVEIGSPAAVPSKPLWLNIPPAAIPVIVAAIAIALIPLAPNLLARDKSVFRCTVPFFIGGQILFGIVTVNWLLNKKTWGQKIRHALMIVAASMSFGTLCNLINVGRSTLRPGLRIEISAGEYLLMNIAAMLCVIGYFVWDRIRNGELQKRAELLAATLAAGAAGASTSTSGAGTAALPAPSAAVSQTASPTSQAVSKETIQATSSASASAPSAEPHVVPDEKQATDQQASPAVSLSLKTDQAEPLAAATSDAAKPAKSQGSSPNKGPSKKPKSGSHKNGGSQKGGSSGQKSGSSGQSKGGSPKNNGKKNDGSTQKGNNGNGPKKKPSN